MGGGGGSQTVGYKYYLGLHFILCHGEIDSVTRLSVADRIAWSGENKGGESNIESPGLFGGEDNEGGVSGIMAVNMGGKSQLRDLYLFSKIGANIPSYRGVVGVVLKGFDDPYSGFYIGNSPYLKNFAFRAKRNTKRTDGRAPMVGLNMDIGDDMNPIAIIHECLTDRTWGLGYDYQDIDESSFASAGSTLLNENMGMSMMWDSQVSLEDFIMEVLRHIDAVLYVNIFTGLFTVKLIRDDYDFSTLPVLNESNIATISDYSRPVMGELVNSLTVKYWDVASGSDASLTVQDIALQLSQQQTIATTVNYPGFTNNAIISKVAARDLFSLSAPLISCTIFGTRELTSMTLGDAFRLQWPEHEIDDVIMRVMGIEYGSQGDSKIKISATQDAYAAGSAIVAAPPISEWVDYKTDPTPVLYPKLVEIPYWDIVMRKGQIAADSLGEDDTGFLAFATKPSGDALNFAIYTPGVNGYTERSIAEFTGSAMLSANIGYQNTEIPFTDVKGVSSYPVGKYIQVDDELMSVVQVGSTSVTVERAVLDTIPTLHSAGSFIYMNGINGGSDDTIYQYNEIAYVKLLTVTANGMLDESSTQPLSISLNSRRQYRPYPPGNVKILDAVFPAAISDALDLSVTWNSRDRLQLTTETLYSWFNGSNFGEEVGTTYTVQLLQPSGTLISEQTGLTTFTATFALSLFSSYNELRIKVWSERDGYTCWQIFDYTFTRTYIENGDSTIVDNTSSALNPADSVEEPEDTYGIYQPEAWSERRLVVEAPYYLVNQDANASIGRLLVYAYALDTTETDILYSEVWARVIDPSHTALEYRGDTYHCPNAQVDAEVWMTDTVISIKYPHPYDLSSVTIGSMVAVNSELMRVDAVSATSVTVGRGILDTVPVIHPVDSRLFFIGSLNEKHLLDTTNYNSAKSHYAFLPLTSTGYVTTPIPSEYVVDVEHRSAYIHPPANVKINGMRYPQGISENDNITLTWSHRDRVQQMGTPFVDNFDAQNIGPESGVTYRVNVYARHRQNEEFSIPDGLKSSWAYHVLEATGITGNSFTFSKSDLISNLSGNPGSEGYRVGETATVIQIMIQPEKLDGYWPWLWPYQKFTSTIFLLKAPAGTTLFPDTRPSIHEVGRSYDTGSGEYDPVLDEIIVPDRQHLPISEQPVGGYVLWSETVPTTSFSRCYLIMKFMLVNLSMYEDHTESANYYFRKNGAVLNSGLLTNLDTVEEAMQYIQFDVDIDPATVLATDTYDIVIESIKGDWYATPYMAFIYYP